MPDRRVFDLTRAGMNRSYYYFAGIDSDPALDRRTATRGHLRRIFLQLFLHPERCIERSLRMVLMGYRRPEQRENPVPRRLHHIPVIAMGRVDHQLQRRIDNRARSEEHTS